MRAVDTSSHLPVKADRHVGENVGSDGDVRNGLHQRAHEAAERPRTLRDHVEAIERDVEQCVEHIGTGEIDEKVVRRRSHAPMGENDPDDNGVAAHGQKDHRGEQEEKDALDKRCPEKIAVFESDSPARREADRRTTGRHRSDCCSWCSDRASSKRFSLEDARLRSFVRLA